MSNYDQPITCLSARKAASIGMARFAWVNRDSHLHPSRALINPEVYDAIRKEGNPDPIIGYVEIKGVLHAILGGCRIMVTHRVPVSRIEFEV